MGSKRLILLGNCGVLDKRIEDCGIIIPIKAVRGAENLSDEEYARRLREEGGK